jgi:hypothetical protein
VPFHGAQDRVQRSEAERMMIRNRDAVMSRLVAL